ncbi:MAG: HAD-IIA family hydrolase [Clostridia bacterium]|nr:HAD-IIA family hydrolase [Clostridia bacterium]
MIFQNPDISILRDKELFIFDMDGTIYLGGKVFGFAVDFIDRLRENGKKILFFTNNASHTTPYYLNKLNALGFAPKREEIMTSGDVTKVFLKRRRKGKSVYLVGTDELVEDFYNSGVRLFSGDVDSVDIVVTSFDTSLTYEKLSNACRFVRGGAEYLSTHPDFNCPTEDGFIPDSGAIAAFVTASTGKTPTYFGKPYVETLDMICEATGVSKEKMCIFGDRLYTDIALGAANGVTSVLVLTGETKAEDLDASTVKPAFVFPSLAEVDKEMFDK